MSAIIFLRTAWMANYKGLTESDKPDGAGSFVKEHQDGGEVCNFLPINNNYYGFARIRKGNNLRIQRLGASSEDNFIDKVTVVFFATDPLLGGQFIVGWFDQARLFRNVQDLPSSKRKGHPYYLCSTLIKNGTLLPVNQRTFEIPDDGPGQTNAWYVSEYKYANKYLKEFEQFKNYPSKYKRKKVSNTDSLSGRKGWQLDAETRKKIELAAMDATAEYFEKKGYEITYVHNEKLGWDMEVKKRNKKLLLEIKGTSTELGSVSLTPNEYNHSKIKKDYRICILEKALIKNGSVLHICRLNFNGKKWISESGKQFIISEIKSALLSAS